MKFHEVVEKVQSENPGYIVLIRSGIFFVAVGKDAIMLNKLFNFKLICFKEKTCKCGIPVSSMKNYIPKFKQTGYSFLIYDYTDGVCKNIYRIDEKLHEEESSCMDCLKCNIKPKISIAQELKILEEM
ncbi:MAG: hypothetical protein Q4G09_08320 [Clostridia bacterium]|nr:hypothetical protein [Clostridia bacterium]